MLCTPTGSWKGIDTGVMKDSSFTFIFSNITGWALGKDHMFLGIYFPEGLASVSLAHLEAFQLFQPRHYLDWTWLLLPITRWFGEYLFPLEMRCIINAIYSDADSNNIWVYSLHYILYYTLQAYVVHLYTKRKLIFLVPLTLNFFPAILRCNWHITFVNLRCTICWYI